MYRSAQSQAGKVFLRTCTGSFDKAHTSSGASDEFYPIISSQHILHFMDLQCLAGGPPISALRSQLTRVSPKASVHKSSIPYTHICIYRTPPIRYQTPPPTTSMTPFALPTAAPLALGVSVSLETGTTRPVRPRLGDDGPFAVEGRELSRN